MSKTNDHLTLRMGNKSDKYVKYNLRTKYVFRGYIVFVLLSWSAVAILLLSGYLIGLGV